MLSLIVFLPLAGALLVLVAGGAGDRPDREPAVRMLSLATSLATFAATLVLWWRFDPTSAEYQFVEQHAWIPAFGIQYLIGVDGISLFLVILTGFLTPLALVSSWESVHKNVKVFSFFLLALETSMLGVFVSIDLFLFYIFWDFVLIPMYFLIGIWGYERRIYAAVKFILYTMAGSVLMLIAIIGLAWTHAAVSGSPSFNLNDLYNLNLSRRTEMWFFLAFTLAFVIKVPLFPFHTWLPDAHVEAPTAGSVILAGVMLKMGTYGLLRFSFPLFPNATAEFAPVLAVLGVVGIIYGALVAMVQPDLKKLVAYSSVSHLGFVILGLAAVNVQAVQGAIYQMLNHGVSTGGLFMMVGMLSDRRHTRLIAEFGGLKAVMPRLVAAFLLITLSSIALPGMNGFVGEFLILLGSFRWNPRITAFAATGVILSAVYMLWMFQRVNYGEVTNEKNRSLPDLSMRELSLVVPTIAMAIVMGVFPTFFTHPMEASVNKTIERIHGRIPTRVERLTPAPLTADRDPLTADRWPLTVDRDPLTADRGPLTVDRDPLAADRWPLTVNRDPLTADRWPLTVKSPEQSAATEKPRVLDPTRSLSEGPRRMETGERIPAGRERPTASPSTRAELTARSGRAAGGRPRPAASDLRPAASDLRSAASGSRPAASPSTRAELTARSGRAAGGRPRPAANGQRSSVSGERPAASGQRSNHD